jgi:hypothetical protein
MAIVPGGDTVCRSVRARSRVIDSRYAVYMTGFEEPRTRSDKKLDGSRYPTFRITGAISL